MLFAFRVQETSPSCGEQWKVPSKYSSFVFNLLWQLAQIKLHLLFAIDFKPDLLKTLCRWLGSHLHPNHWSPDLGKWDQLALRWWLHVRLWAFLKVATISLWSRLRSWATSLEKSSWRETADGDLLQWEFFGGMAACRRDITHTSDASSLQALTLAAGALALLIAFQEVLAE